jgi:hypothetical protein
MSKQPTKTDRRTSAFPRNDNLADRQRDSVYFIRQAVQAMRDVHQDHGERCGCSFCADSRAFAVSIGYFADILEGGVPPE